jgi:hypothetical protein
LERTASDIGPFKTMDWLESSASQAIRLSARHAIEFADPEIAFETLYARYITQKLVPVQSEEPIVGHVSCASLNVQRAFSTYGWLLAVAVTITFVAGRSVRSNSVTHLSLPRKEALETEQLDAFPIIPLLPASLRVPIHLDITEPGNVSRPWHEAALRAYRRPQSRKSFRLHAHVNPLVEVRRVVTESTVPPSLPIPIQNQRQDLSPVLGPPVPSLPEFHPRHRRFIRALAAPFRMLAILVTGHRDT